MTNKVDCMYSGAHFRVIDLKVDPSKQSLTHIRIGQVGHLPGRTSCRRKANFDSWAVVYIARGEGIYREYPGEEIQVRGGSLFFFRPGERYDFGPDHGSCWDEYYINIYGPRIQEWVGNGLIAPGQVHQVGQNDKWIHKFEWILMQMDSGIPANADRACLQLESLLYEFMLTASHRSDEGKGQWEELLQDLQRGVYEDIEPEQLAEEYHVSVSTLRRLVRNRTGYPLNDYIQRLKISEAKQLLLNTDKQIKEIALLLKFQDPLYFSRRFKKFTGISANSYRSSI